jgi:hypothetical protein
MTQSTRSLKEEYEHALGLKRGLEAPTVRRDSSDYQDKVQEAVQSFDRCLQLINRLSLFSSNEGLEDVNTGDIVYMSVEYNAASVKEKVNRGTDGRLDVVREAVGQYLRFLRLVENYEILPKEYNKRFSDISTLKDLSKLTPTDAVKRRAEKVEQFKKEKELRSQIDTLKGEMDEEIQRKLYIMQVELNAIQAIKSLQTMAMELELLESMQGRPSDTLNTEQQQQRTGDTGYTTRVEQAPFDHKKGPLLNKQGKVLQPFTIVSSRDKIAKGVFGTGQVLPTMTVEQYLEEEMRRGGVITGGGEASAKKEEDTDEDNIEKADAETYRLRKWDEFTDSVARGSGNTYNRG